MEIKKEGVLFMTTKTDVIVAGGGIGGLAAALSIEQKTGKSVKILEQAPEFGEVGAGIQLAPNALEVLKQLGVMGEIEKLAVFPKRLVLRDLYTAKELAVLDLGDSFKEHFENGYLVMHRSDLHGVLLKACEAYDNISFETNQHIIKAENTANGVVVTSASGATFEADAVIGADGLKSNIRKQFKEDEMICSEYVAYRGTIPIEEVSEDTALDDVMMWIGPNLHLVQYPVRRGELYNQVVVFKSYEYKADSEDWGTPEEMDRRFENSHPQVVNALSFIHRQIRWPMYDRLPLDNWTDGNIALLGDSAHPMLQYLAQGACQALEDALVLGEKLAEKDSYNEAFIAYQEERLERTATVQTNARAWGEFIHAEDPFIIKMRDAIFERHTAQDFSPAEFLYGYHKRRQVTQKA